MARRSAGPFHFRRDCNVCLFDLDIAPLGALVAYSDGAPRPPARFPRSSRPGNAATAPAGWSAGSRRASAPTYTCPPYFTLHEGTFGQNGIILVSLMRTYGIDSELRFRVIERPRIGRVRVLQSVGDGEELLHLAESREAAELWLARNRHHQARIDEVTADEISADAVEGRAAA
ncbi:hypothetical protein [Mesorhizobium australicum]|uniref:hypothetical protein n=1 Tax=Mesorhizobium australicum TaxID=536018 RepID=UPI0032AF8FFA